MRKHLKGCFPYRQLFRNMDNQTLQDLFGSSQKQKQIMNRDRLKETVLWVIVSGNLPFSFADNLEFQTLLREAYPSCQPPNRKSARDYLQSVVDRTTEDLKAKLATNDSKISLVLDAWTTRSSLSFLGNLSPLSLFAVTGWCCLFVFWLRIPLQVVTGCNGKPPTFDIICSFPVTFYTRTTALIFRCYRSLDW